MRFDNRYIIFQIQHLGNPLSLSSSAANANSGNVEKEVIGLIKVSVLRGGEESDERDTNHGTIILFNIGFYS